MATILDLQTHEEQICYGNYVTIYWTNGVREVRRVDTETLVHLFNVIVSLKRPNADVYTLEMYIDNKYCWDAKDGVWINRKDLAWSPKTYSAKTIGELDSELKKHQNFICVFPNKDRFELRTRFSIDREGAYYSLMFFKYVIPETGEDKTPFYVTALSSFRHFNGCDSKKAIKAFKDAIKKPMDDYANNLRAPYMVIKSR